MFSDLFPIVFEPFMSVSMDNFPKFKQKCPNICKDLKRHRTNNQPDVLTILIFCLPKMHSVILIFLLIFAFASIGKKVIKGILQIAHMIIHYICILREHSSVYIRTQAVPLSIIDTGSADNRQVNSQRQ